MMVDFLSTRNGQVDNTLRPQLAHGFPAILALNLLFCSLANDSFRGYPWSSGHYLSFFCFVALGKRDRSKLFWLHQSTIIEAIVLVVTEAPTPEQLAI